MKRFIGRRSALEAEWIWPRMDLNDTGRPDRSIMARLRKKPHLSLHGLIAIVKVPVVVALIALMAIALMAPWDGPPAERLMWLGSPTRQSRSGAPML